ncbi:MAG: DedA family protein [Acidobacteriia bacterium]|nr:DedA family protein [Terriglobia bacterium]
MDAVFTWITTYGYGAIFLLLMLGVVGLPIPDETLLVFSGYLISKGTMHPLPAWMCAVAGSWCGISLSYTIGRTLGLGFIHKFGKYIHVTEERLTGVHKWFDRMGHWVLFFGYYIAGVRHFSAILAGTSGLSFPSFIAYAWAGGLLWVTTFLTLGYYLGENWKQIAELIHHYLLYVSLAVLAAALCYYIWKRRQQHGGQS